MTAPPGCTTTTAGHEGQGTHRQVMNAVRLLREHEVEVNALVLLNDVNVKEPDAIYEFLKDNEFYFMQFVPCVEPGGPSTGSGREPAPFSITPEAYGDFLVRVFDLWVADFPGVSVRDFDDLLLYELGRPPGTCMVSDHCADYVVVEHNGDVFVLRFLSSLPNGAWATSWRRTLESWRSRRSWLSSGRPRRSWARRARAASS